MMFMFKDANTGLAMQEAKFADFFSRYTQCRNDQDILLLEVEAVKLRDEYKQQVEFHRLMVLYYRERLQVAQDLGTRQWYYRDYQQVIVEVFSIWNKWRFREKANWAAYQCMKQFISSCQELRVALKG